MTDNVVNIDTMRSPLDFAARYIRLGWYVLPLDPGTKKPLGRLVPRGFQDATNDFEVASKWWRQQPDAGIGVALRASGLVAVDIDPRNGGIDTMSGLESAHGPIVSDVLALTGGGGEHRVFSADLVDGLPGTLGPGVDLKADGYIAVEPTIHPSGKRYGWEFSSSPLDGVVPSTLPGWIRDLSRERLALPTSSVLAVPLSPARLADLLSALSAITKPDRDTWYRVGMAINNSMPNSEGFGIWDQWSQENGSTYDPQDQFRVWRSFRPVGLKGISLDSVFRMAIDAGWRAQKVKQPSVIQIDENGKETARKNMLLTLRQLEKAMLSVTWSVKHIVPQDSVGFIFGGSGTFKSFIALDYGLHVAHGMNWLGKKTKKGAVIFIAAEGGSGISRRATAWHRQHSAVNPDDAEFYVIPHTISLTEDASSVVEDAAALGVVPSVIIIDTLAQTFDGEENSAKEVGLYLKALGHNFRERWHCVVMIVHHSGHAATERPRGSSALRSNADFMFGVFREEQQMMATMCAVKVKDGELFPDCTFAISSHHLWSDEDGDQVSSLVAKAVTGEALAETLIAESKAGRGGRDLLLISLAQNGMPEKELRAIFYENIDAPDADARKHAYNRAKKWAVNNRYIEVAQGHVLVLKSI